MGGAALCADGGHPFVWICNSTLETVPFCGGQRTLFVYSSDTFYQRLSGVAKESKPAAFCASGAVVGRGLSPGWQRASCRILVVASSSGARRKRRLFFGHDNMFSPVSLWDCIVVLGFAGYARSGVPIGISHFAFTLATFGHSGNGRIFAERFSLGSGRILLAVWNTVSSGWIDISTFRHQTFNRSRMQRHPLDYSIVYYCFALRAYLLAEAVETGRPGAYRGFAGPAPQWISRLRHRAALHSLGAAND